MGNPRSRQKPAFGVLFWIAAILLVAVLFMVNLPSMQEVLDRTNFVEVVFETPGADSAEQTPQDDPGTTPPPAPGEPVATPAPTLTEDPAPTQPSTPEPEDSSPQPTQTETDDTPRPDKQDELVVVPAQDEGAEEGAPSRSRRSQLYFIRVTEDGRIMAEAVDRIVPFATSPLTETIEALISGPTSDDLNRGLLSLIPGGTDLRSARVEGGVAYLDFSEEFRFNPMGLEGYLAQMQQVVRTATTFSTVDAVQILIEGRRLSYLGGDGVYIGAPVRPEDFSI